MPIIGSVSRESVDLVHGDQGERVIRNIAEHASQWWPIRGLLD